VPTPLVVLVVEALGKGLLGTTLRYNYEVRDENMRSRAFHASASPKTG
jgi:non-homologous end joining protein Ku